MPFWSTKIPTSSADGMNSLWKRAGIGPAIHGGLHNRSGGGFQDLKTACFGVETWDLHYPNIRWCDIYIYIYNMHEWTSYIIYIYIFIKSEIFQNYGQIQQNVGECSVELGWVTARLSISIWKSSSDRNIYSREISIVTFHFIALGNSSAN
jgi:hypothetical protein